MIRPATKIALEVVAGLAAVTVLLGALVAWRLSEGPVQVSFLAPLVEGSINDQLEVYQVDVGDIVIAWTREETAVELQAVDVQVKGPDGRILGEIPRIATDFSLRAVLDRRLVPKRLALDGASLTLVRRADGTMRFGLSEVDPDQEAAAPPLTAGGDGPEADPLLNRLLDAVSAPGEGEAEGLRLEGLSIRNASISVFDQRSGGLWLAPDVELEFRNTTRGMAGVVQARVLSPGGEWELVGTIRSSGPEEPIVLAAEVNDITLPDFSRTLVVLEPLAMIDSAVSGRVRANLERDGLSISRLEIDLTAGPGTLRLPIPEPAPFVPPAPLGYDGEPTAPDPVPPYVPKPWTYELDGAHIAGSITWPDGEFVLDDFALEGRRLNLAVSGKGRAAAEAGEGITEVDMQVSARDLAADIPNVTVGVARIDALDMELNIRPGDGRVEMPEVRVGLGEGHVTLSGVIDRLDQPVPSVDLTGELHRLLIADVMQAWPPRVGHGARKWVAENVSAGEIDHGSIRIDATNGELGEHPIPDDAIALTADYADITVSYLGGMSPVEEARGSITLTGNSFAATMDGGTITPAQGGLVSVTGGSFKTRDFQIRGNDAFIVADIAGSMESLLALLDEEPLGYTSQFGLDPAQVKGSGTVRFDTVLPMRNALRFSDVRFGAKGNARDVALPPLAEDLTLSDGQLAFDVNNERLVSSGTIDLSGHPVDLRWTEDFNAAGGPGSTFEVATTLNDDARTRFGAAMGDRVSGPVVLEAVLKGSGPDISQGSFVADLTGAVLHEPLLGWHKPAGEAARMTGEVKVAADGGVSMPVATLSGDNIQMQASARLDAEGRLMEADVPLLMAGQGTDLTARAARSDDGALRVEVTGRGLDGRPLFDELFADREADEDEETAEPPLFASARIDRVFGHGGEVVSGVDAYLHIENGSVRQLSVDGAFESGGELDVEMRPTTYGTRTIKAETGNAGAFLRTTDLYASVEGGTLDFTGEIDDRDETRPLKGELKGADLRVRDAPVVADVLTLGSLTGIRDTLQGDGILFTRLEAPVTISDRNIDLHDAIVSGPALGATVKGHVDREADTIDLGGTIVPAYTINTFIGNLPIIGDLMTSREGEGIIGITYAVSGDADKPTVTVNPLSALLPGILRRLFEMGGSASDEVAEGNSDEVAEGSSNTPAEIRPRPNPESGG